MDLRGSFGGIVEDNKDPQKLGRLKVRVPHAYGAVGGVFGAVPTNDLPWALPVGMPSGLSQASGGADWLPEIGDQVLVQFLDGEPEKPVWQWFMQTLDAVEDFPLHAYETGKSGSVGKPKRGAWVRYGHTVEWNSEGLIMTTSKGYRLLLTDASSAGKDGDISITTQAGQLFEFDDSTGDSTLNVNNNWNINVQEQILAIANAFSLTTLNQEIELISGDKLTVDTTKNLEVTVGKDWSVDVIGTAAFNLAGSWTVNVLQSATLNATANMTVASSANLSVAAGGTLTLGGSGGLAMTSAGPCSMGFSQLLLGVAAISPYVLGDQLFAYLTALYSVLLSHSHPGVMPGPSTTGIMTPAPPAPPPTMLSQVIKGI
jgi:hypothetical protein